MSRYVSLAAIGALAVGFTLFAPAQSQAQSFGLHLDIGRPHHDFGRDYHHGRYHGSAYDYGRHGRHGHRHHGHHDHDHYAPSYRQPVVIPDYSHWTPDRGYHSHGRVLVPHRGHYHVRPY